MHKGLVVAQPAQLQVVHERRDGMDALQLPLYAAPSPPRIAALAERWPPVAAAACCTAAAASRARANLH